MIKLDNEFNKEQQKNFKNVENHCWRQSLHCFLEFSNGYKCTESGEIVTICCTYYNTKQTLSTFAVC